MAKDFGIALTDIGRTLFGMAIMFEINEATERHFGLVVGWVVPRDVSVDGGGRRVDSLSSSSPS